MRVKVVTVMRWYVQDKVNQDYSEQNEVDGMKKGADSTGKVMHMWKSGWWLVMRKINQSRCIELYQLSNGTKTRKVSAPQPCLYEDLSLPSQRCLTPTSWRTPWDINAIYTSLKSTFSGLTIWVYLHSFICYCRRNMRKMSRNSKRFWP